MNGNDLEVDAFFTTNGKDIWKLKTFFNEPSCLLENMDDTATREEFGVSSLAAQRFHRIKMPISSEEPSSVPLQGSVSPVSG
jgi:hypothetical protein